ncbi:hypothetical protein RI065_05630 [Mycoplasmatota bacterium zrk1]
MNKLLMYIVLTLSIILVGCQARVTVDRVVEADIEDYAKGIVLQISENKIQVASETDEINGTVWLSITERTRYSVGVSNQILVGNYVEIAVAEFNKTLMEAEVFIVTVNLVIDD